jgi:hypothetical protein
VANDADRVDGVGHTWPGGKQYLPKLIIGTTSDSFNAAATIWQSFASHRFARTTRGDGPRSETPRSPYRAVPSQTVD